MRKGIRHGVALLLAGTLAFTSAGGVKAPAWAAERSTVEMDLTGLEEFSLSAVTLTDDYLVNAYAKEAAYLTSFDTDRLLAGFRDTAGLDSKGAIRYAGWENSLIGGHTLGHYLTACVQAYESANATEAEREELLTILSDLAVGLKECQDAVGTGFIFGAVVRNRNNIEQQFDNVEKNKTNITTEAWVPWYTMHKILEGLVSLANMTAADAAEEAVVAEIKATAAETVSKLADWVYARTSSWSAATRNTVLGIEYGGMNDCLYDVYLITGKTEHLEAAHAFDQTALFDKVLHAEPGADVLNNLHANTTIPKFLGALKCYVVSGEEIYFDYAEKFWTLVTENHSYITGGNSEWEHFGQDNVLDNERTNCNCETCNSYNMLKLTKLLFLITGDVKYADWYENTFFNSILSSQNPETGMTTYFQPMASGYFKVYGEQFTKFWCCTGSGMENFTKLGESFYFHKDNLLVVNQYLSSELKDERFGLKQEAGLPESDTVTFTLTKALDGTLAFRLPEWLAADAVITVDGTEVNYAVTGAGEGCNGYAVLAGNYAAGTTIRMTLPMEVRAYALPDGENTYAFQYGPVVLSALLGTEAMFQSTTGVDVSIPGERVLSAEYLPSESEKITVLTDTVAEFMENINTYLVRDTASEELRFTLRNTDANLTYVTHYSQYKERYGIYFKFTDDHSALDAQAILNDKTATRMEAYRLDTVQPGYGQYENDALHCMTESGEGSVGSTENGTSRYAKKNGSFSYTMLVNPLGCDLLATFDSADNGKSIRITAGDKVVYEAVLDSGDHKGCYDIVIPVPGEVLASEAKKITVDGKEYDAVTFTFAGVNNEQSAALCEFLYTMQKMSDDTKPVSVTADTGALYYSESRSRYLLKVTEDTKEVTVSAELPSKYAYIEADGVVSEEEKLVFPVNDSLYTGYMLRIYAENHQDYQDYSFVIQRGEAPETETTGTLAYFVDCGDHDVTTVSAGDSFGTHQSVTEQLYGVDAGTGYFWGLADDAEDRYNGSKISDGLYTANTWCYEFNALKDGLDKTATNRYTKNQYESGIPRHLDYLFELEDGTYSVTVGFADPWGCSKKPSLYAYYGEENEQLLAEKIEVADETVTCEVTVTGGMLSLNLRSEDKAINITHIEIEPLKVQEAEEDYVFVSGGLPAANPDTGANVAADTGAERDKDTVEGTEKKEDEAEVKTGAEAGTQAKAGSGFAWILTAVGAAAVIVAGIVVVFAKRRKNKK
ncbi:MAG: glycoside hydrolase family 127 protein [Lachnospiraceae bacterium]